MINDRLSFRIKASTDANIIMLNLDLVFPTVRMLDPKALLYINTWIRQEKQAYFEEHDTRNRWIDTLWSYDHSACIEKEFQVTLNFNEHWELESQEIEEVKQDE